MTTLRRAFSVLLVALVLVATSVWGPAGHACSPAELSAAAHAERHHAQHAHKEPCCTCPLCCALAVSLPARSVMRDEATIIVVARRDLPPVGVAAAPLERPPRATRA